LRDRVDARPVAISRVMQGVALMLVSLEQFVALSRIADGALAYPFFSWAPAPTITLAVAVLTLGWLTGFCLVLGLLPEMMAGAGAGLRLRTLLWDQQLYSSHVTLLTLLLALLSCAESDRRWRVYGRRYECPLVAPWWPQLLMMTQVSVVYLFAGLSKMQPTFLSGRPLSEWMWLSLPQVAYVILAWGTVLTEVFLAVAL